MQTYWLVVPLTWLFLVCSICLSDVHVEKYVAGSYFDEHGSLVDSAFADFIRNQLQLRSCQMPQDDSNFVPQVLVLDRVLIGEGSHRRLSSSISFDLGSVVTPHSQLCSWELILIERLPSGVFADPFELQHLVQRGVFDSAVVFGDTNLELPSFRSNRSLVEIHKRIDLKAMAGDKAEFNIHVDLPLHARYQPLGHDGYSRIKFGLPDLIMDCSYQSDATNKSCLMSTNYHVDSKNVDIVWEIPRGIKEHATIVSAVTFISAIVSALFIVLTSINHSQTTAYDLVKQS